MKQRLFFSLIFFSFWAMVSGGCASATAGIAVSNIPLENKEYEVIGPAETTVHWFAFDIAILGAPFSIPPIDKAVRTLLGGQKGDALINIRYSTDRFIFAFITMHRFHIQADVVRIIDSKGRKQK